MRTFESKTFFANVRLLAAFALVCCSVSLVAEEPTIGTRKVGEDWAAFLGPRGDGTSSRNRCQA